MPQCAPHAGTQLPSRDSGTRHVGTRPPSERVPYDLPTWGVFSISGRNPPPPQSQSAEQEQGSHMKMTGAQALIKSLEMQGVDVMFGLPGGAILPVYDPIIDSSIRPILVRHEQGAGHMGEGYAQV